MDIKSGPSAQFTIPFDQLLCTMKLMKSMKGQTLHVLITSRSAILQI